MQLCGRIGSYQTWDGVVDVTSEPNDVITIRSGVTSSAARSLAPKRNTN